MFTGFGDFGQVKGDAAPLGLIGNAIHHILDVLGIKFIAGDG